MSLLVLAAEVADCVAGASEEVRLMVREILIDWRSGQSLAG